MSGVTVGTGRATREPRHLVRLFAEKLPALEAGIGGFDALVLSAAATEPLGAAQADLDTEGDGAAGRDDLSRLLDRLGNRLGTRRLHRARLAARHIPERAQRAAPPLSPPTSTEALWPHERRPVELLPRPEPVEVVEGAADGPPVSVPLAPPPPAGPQRRGAGAQSPPSGGTTPPPTALAAVRDYYRVEDGDGARYWLFRTGAGREWFVHGLFG